MNHPRSRVWVLYERNDTDNAAVFEIFSRREGEPSNEYIRKTYGSGWLYAYREIGGTLTDKTLVRFIAPKQKAQKK